MQVISNEYKHPTTGQSAYHDVATYDDGSTEHFAHVRDEKGNMTTTRHSSPEKAVGRLSMHGYCKDENQKPDAVNESMTHGIGLDAILAESFCLVDSRTAYAKTLMESGLSESDAFLKQREAVFLLTHAGGLFESADQATKFLNSEHGSTVANCDGALIESTEVITAAGIFKEHASEIQCMNESYLMVESAPPGMEKWVKDNKDDFADRYGEDSEKALYATAWSIYNKKHGRLDETVMDTVTIDHNGEKRKVSWNSEAGFHSITSANPNGSTNYHAIGDHKKIADKWARLKAAAKAGGNA